MNDFGKKKFKEYAKMNRLRLKTSEDGYPVVISRGKKFEGCMLYDGFSDDFVGLLVVRDTASKLSHLANKVDKMGLTPLIRGDYEATYKVPYSKIWEVAKFFNMVKKKPSNQNVEGLKRFRENISAS
jgi:hypothetical protein